MGEFIFGRIRKSLVLKNPVHQLFQGISFVPLIFITALCYHERQFAVAGAFQMIAAVVCTAGSNR